MVPLMEFIADTGPLLRVRGRAMDGSWERLVFVFERGSVRLCVDPNSDEIMTAVIATEAVGLEDISQEDEFRPLVGRVAEYAWSMVNHRGYSDAFQLRFLDLQDKTTVTRQFEAAAAVIWVTGVA
jgi:hypothetical protein